VARAYGVHPVTLAKWKRHFLEHGVEIALLKNFFKRELTLARRLELVEKHRQEYGLNRCLVPFLCPSPPGTATVAPKVSRKDVELKEKILRVVKDHPAYGYRRIKAELAAAGGEGEPQAAAEVAFGVGPGVKAAGGPAPAQRVRKILKEAEGSLIWWWCPTVSAERRTTRGWNRSGRTPRGENVSLFLEAATFEELEWVIGKQVGYYNNERRHSRLEYWSPVEYLTRVGFIPKTLAENGRESGSVSGAQAHVLARWVMVCDHEGLRNLCYVTYLAQRVGFFGKKSFRLGDRKLFALFKEQDQYHPSLTVTLSLSKMVKQFTAKDQGVPHIYWIWTGTSFPNDVRIPLGEEGRHVCGGTREGGYLYSAYGQRKPLRVRKTFAKGILG